MSSRSPQKKSRVTVPALHAMKERGEKIAMLTAYDYPFARILDQAGIDILLVGDSLGVVVLGYENTLPVTMDQIVYHTQAVAKACERALVVFDLPFMSYQAGVDDAIRNAGRAIKEGAAHTVKLEGGTNIAPIIQAIVAIDIPVMGHIGLTPQSIHRMGGHRVQGRKSAQRTKLLDDAKAVEDAGAYALVIEGVPADLGAEITASVSIPTIGIGAGSGCDGQVLVAHDMLGIYPEFNYTFVKQYVNLKRTMTRAVKNYIDEVKEGVFPGAEHSYK